MTTTRSPADPARRRLLVRGRATPSSKMSPPRSTLAWAQSTKTSIRWGASPSCLPGGCRKRERCSTIERWKLKSPRRTRARRAPAPDAPTGAGGANELFEHPSRSRRRGVATLTPRSPDNLNALNFALVDELRDAVSVLPDAAPAALLTDRGAAFQAAPTSAAAAGSQTTSRGAGGAFQSADPALSICRCRGRGGHGPAPVPAAAAR